MTADEIYQSLESLDIDDLEMINRRATSFIDLKKKETTHVYSIESLNKDYQYFEVDDLENALKKLTEIQEELYKKALNGNIDAIGRSSMVYLKRKRVNKDDYYEEMLEEYTPR